MRSTLSLFTALSTLLLGLGPAAARAEDASTVGGRTTEVGGRELLTRAGEYFLVGGGLSNFVERSVRDRVDLGGTWDVRLGVGSRFYLGAEAAYVGSARSAGTLGTNLLTNGAEAVVRAQLPYQTGRWLIEPFVFGGAGWTHFDLRNARAGQQGTDDVLAIPFGGGVTIGRDHVLLDARFTYRQTFDETLLRNPDGSAASLKSWGVVASLGYEF